jgi:hypothetical protein
MTKPQPTTMSRTKLKKLEEALSALIAGTLHAGFFGSAQLEFNVQDGGIQQIRWRIERIER